MTVTFPGVNPVDRTTLVGQTRDLIGDLNYVSASYQYFSDATIGTFLLMGAQNPLLAAALGLNSLARDAAAASANVSALDLKADLTKRAADLRAVADQLIEIANMSEFSTIVGTGIRTIDLRDLMYPTGRLILSDLVFTRGVENLGGSVATQEDTNSPGYLFVSNELTGDPQNPGYLLP
jgi:hypothetical protein